MALGKVGWARLFQSFLVASTAFSVLLIVNSKISLQQLQTGTREMCTAISRAACNTVMDVWLCLKMESIMSTHNCTFVAEGECWFARITTKLSPCFNIPTEANDTIALLTATPVSLYMATAHSYFGAFLIEWGSSPKRVKALKEIVPRYQ